MDQNEKFEYTYSAKQQAELETIREKYLPREETKMDKLRRLDRSVTRPGAAVSIAMGVAGTLVMGFGMCCVMVWTKFVSGIIIGIAGMVMIGMAYPVFAYITKKRREQLAPEILKLTEEIEQDNFQMIQ